MDCILPGIGVQDVTICSVTIVWDVAWDAMVSCIYPIVWHNTLAVISTIRYAENCYGLHARGTKIRKLEANATNATICSATIIQVPRSAAAHAFVSHSVWHRTQHSIEVTTHCY